MQCRTSSFCGIILFDLFTTFVCVLYGLCFGFILFCFVILSFLLFLLYFVLFSLISVF